MNVQIIFQIASIGILTLIVSQILQHSGKNEIATLASLAGVVLVLIMVLDQIALLFEKIQTIFNLF